MFSDRFGYPDRETVDRLKEEFPKGCRVMLDYMDDRNAPPSGTKGTVIGVDGIGSIMVNWDNGSTLSVAYGADSCHRISK